MQPISTTDLAGVCGGLTVREAGRNAVDNVSQWGRAVYGRLVLGAGFARGGSVDAYSKQLEAYDIHRKPVLPTK